MERDEKQFNETAIIEGSYYDINEEGTRDTTFAFNLSR